MRRRVTFHLGSPILLPNRGPATPDSWLAWAQIALTKQDFRHVRPQAVDWVPDPVLPLLHDAQHDVWCVSSLIFPDPGVWIPNRGYRKDPNSGDLSGRAAAFALPIPVTKTLEKESLFTHDEASGSIYRGMIYDLSGWHTPRIEWIVEFETHQAPALERLLDLLAAVGVGRKTADGYGFVRDWSWVDTADHPIWTDDHSALRRPVPAISVPDLSLPQFVYALHGSRWSGVPTLCAGPEPDRWHPSPWVRPTSSLDDSSPGKDDLNGNEVKHVVDGLPVGGN